MNTTIRTTVTDLVAALRKAAAGAALTAADKTAADKAAGARAKDTAKADKP